MNNLVHIRPNRTSNPDDSIRIMTNEFRHDLLSTKKQLVSKLIDKLQNKKVAENQRLKCICGGCGRQLEPFNGRPN